MSSTGEEQEEIHVKLSLMEDTMLRGENCLIVNLLALKHYNREAFKQTINKIWRPVKTIHCRDIESVLLLMEFEYVRDKQRVQRESLLTIV